MSERLDPGHEALFVDVLLELVGRRRLVVLLDADIRARGALLTQLAEHLRAGDAIVSAGLAPEDPDALLAELAPRLDTAPLGVLIVDAADTLVPDALARLVRLAAADTKCGRTLQVLLAGGPALETGLAEAGLRELVDRIGTLRRVAPSRPLQPVTLPAPPVPRPVLAHSRARIAAGLLVLGVLGGLAANNATADRTEPPDIQVQHVEITRVLAPKPLPRTDLAASGLSGAEVAAGEDAPEVTELAAAATAPVPLPVPKPTAGSGPRQAPPVRQSSGSRHRAQPVAVEDGCRIGPGGQTARDASFESILRGFAADVRSLGYCLGGGANSR